MSQCRRHRKGDSPSREDDFAVRGSRHSVLHSVEQELDAVGDETFTWHGQNSCDGRIHEHLQVLPHPSLLEIGLQDMAELTCTL